MSLKAVIYLPMRDSNRMPPMGKFLRSQKHDQHIWEGREFDLENPEDVTAFNAAIDPACAAYPGKMPRPRPLLIQEAQEPNLSHLEVPIPPVKRPFGKKTVHA